MDDVTRVQTRPAYLTLVVICSAIALAVVFMAGLAFVLAPMSDVSDVPALLLPIFLVLGGASVLAAFAAKRWFVASARSAASLEERLARVRTGVILACAFCEVPAVLGLTYLILGGDAVWAVPFFGGALVSLAMVFPRPSQWEEWLSSTSAGSVSKSPDSPGSMYAGEERRGGTQDE